MASAAGKLAELTVSGKKYNVFNASFEAFKQVDHYNRAVTHVTKADAKFVIEGTTETSALFALFANSRKVFDAELVLFNPHAEGELMKISYKDATITYYAEDYSSTDNTHYKVTVGLSAKTIKQGDGQLDFIQSV